jgi:uncharacterized membrane protein (UPF0127 family)
MASRVHAVVAEDGRVVCERCSIADSFLPRLRGLLGRRDLPSGEGILLSPSSSIHTFFMRFPIDAVFLDRAFRVVGVAPNVRPWRLAGRKRARRVLELHAGESELRGIRPGEQLNVVVGEGGELRPLPSPAAFTDGR